MFVVIDANELFSLLIKGNKSSKEIFFSKNLELIAPEFIIEEFARHKEELLLKTHRTEAEFLEVLSVFNDRIKLILEHDFCQFMPEALRLLPEHTKDAPYMAIALKFNCIIWSEEKLLKKQSAVRVLNTNELFNELISSSLDFKI